MGIRKKNNFFHGIMFHHFHDQKRHYKGQGSINKEHFYSLIKYFGKKNILKPEEFIDRYKKNKLKKNHLCLTFDDGLKCQYDIALPILEDLKLKAFFFINSINLSSKPDHLELYRAFRHLCYENIENFYEDFFKSLKIKNLDLFFKKKLKIIRHWKIKFPFYSYSDIRFRILREYLIDEAQYKKIMFNLFKKKKFDYKKKLQELYMNKSDLKRLSNLNHNIGLHSHSHPTIMRMESRNKQINEYTKNKKILEKIILKEINSMAHPCGSYNKFTLKILDKLKIDIGFRSTLMVDMQMEKINNSKFEIARQDHSNILNNINTK